MRKKHFEEICLLLQLLVFNTLSDYKVKLHVSSYQNKESRCASCRSSPTDPPGCCNTVHYYPTCPGNCDSFMMKCLRPLSDQLSKKIYENITEDKIQSYGKDGRQNFMRHLCGKGYDDSSVNHLKGLTTEYQGVQFIMAAWSNNSQLPTSNLVDVFFINITSPVGLQTSLSTYRGFYGITEASLNFQVVCTTGTHGTDCSQNCTSYCGNTTSCSLRLCCSGNTNESNSELLMQMCSCDREYTNLLCQETANNCDGVDCGEGICVDDINSIRCKCNFGYQGVQCMDIIPNHTAPGIKIAVGVIAGVIALGVAIIAFYCVKYCIHNQKNKRERLNDSYYVTEEDFMREE